MRINIDNEKGIIVQPGGSGFHVNNVPFHEATRLACKIPTGVVNVESYVKSKQGIRQAIIDAFVDNPNSNKFELPSGDWEWPSGNISGINGFRNNMEICGNQTHLYRDMKGQTSGQEIFFIRTETTTNHADRITFKGIKFSLLNVITSFFGYAIGLEAASNCSIIDCDFTCTLHENAGANPAGRTRWGCALFGGDQSASPSAGTNNVIDRVRLRFAQIQGCGDGRSCDGISITNIEVNQANDLAVSVVSSRGSKLQNVSVSDVNIHDVGGSGCVFVGSDGAGSGIGADLVRNISVKNVKMTGGRSPNTTFPYIAAVIVNGGTITENVVIDGVCTMLSGNTAAQGRSVQVNSQDDEISWKGLTLANMELGPVTDNDPIEALFVAGRNISDVKVSNVTAQGRRGLRFVDADRMTVNNCTTTDGTLLVIASSRNLDTILVSNSNMSSSTGFTPGALFFSNTGKNMKNVQLSNVHLSSAAFGLTTDLSGGTMAMHLANVVNDGNQPNAETITGIRTAVNTPGIRVSTQIVVTIPPIASGSTAFVNVSLTGSRLSDLAPGSGITVTPNEDIALINWRVSAQSVARLMFQGPLTGSNSLMNFYRTST